VKNPRKAVLPEWAELSAFGVRLRSRAKIWKRALPVV
jgi:hypothetical protein